MATSISTAASVLPFHPEPIWETALNQWIDCGPPMERLAREEAAKRITDCYAKRENERRDLNLEGLGLTSIDGVIFPPSLVSLQLGYNQITTIQNIDFQRVPYLFLNNNQISCLTGANFEDVHELRLGFNRINSLKGINFYRIPFLYLNHNQITSIEDGLFQEHNAVDLSYNQITALSATNLRNVKLLYLCYNPLTELPVSLASMSFEIIWSINCPLTEYATRVFLDSLIERRDAGLPFPWWFHGEANTVFCTFKKTVTDFIRLFQHMFPEEGGGETLSCLFRCIIYKRRKRSRSSIFRQTKKHC